MEIMQELENNSTAPKKLTIPRAIKSIDKETIKLLGQADRGEITIKSALQAIGVSEVQANKGWTLVKQRLGLREALAAYKSEEMRQLRPAEADQHDAQQVMDKINTRLVSNIENGEDKAVQSCKLLGSRKDLNMWTADSVAGMVVISVPALPATDTTPLLDGNTGQLLTAQQMLTADAST